MKQSLANKYRPSKWEDYCSQTAIVKIIQNEIKNNSLPPVLLFEGPSGCGKTTICQLISNYLNFEYIEKDGASHNGVAEMKKIEKECSIKSISGQGKIIVIDEFHMVTPEGQNALLKLFEKPPKNIIFMLATTDPQKILPTIISRCQRFKLTKIPTKIIYERLKQISDLEGFKYTEEGLSYLAKVAEGGLRLALQYLDTVIALNGEVTPENIIEALGVNEIQENMDLLYSIYKVCYSDKPEKRQEYTKSALEVIQNIYNNGHNLNIFLDQFYGFLVDVGKYKMFNNSFLNTELPETPDLIQEFSKYETKNIIKILNTVQAFRESLQKVNVNILKSFQGFILTLNKE